MCDRNRKQEKAETETYAIIQFEKAKEIWEF